MSDLVADRLEALTDATRDALAGSQLLDKADVLVTNDGRDVDTMEVPQAGAIVIHPLPLLEFPAPKTVRLTWTISIVCGNPSVAEMSARLMDLVDLLYSAEVIRFPDRAAPTDFQRGDDPRRTIPGYAITHTEEHNVRRTS